MRRTVLSVMALACTAVLAGVGPAFADGVSASPVPSAAADESTAPSPVPSAPADEPREASKVPSAEPSKVPSGDQVSVVPSGAPDTGAAPESGQSSSTGGLIGGGAAAVGVLGGAAFVVVRRRRATGA
ncbi:hypothetical protein SALBM311S_09325 [Streptomyces alboniger]